MELGDPCEAVSDSSACKFASLCENSDRFEGSGGGYGEIDMDDMLAL